MPGVILTQLQIRDLGEFASTVCVQVRTCSMASHFGASQELLFRNSLEALIDAVACFFFLIIIFYFQRVLLTADGAAGKTLEGDNPEFASCRSLLRLGPAASFRVNIRAVSYGSLFV